MTDLQAPTPETSGDTLSSLSVERGRCLVDHEIEDLIRQGHILFPSGITHSPKDIQPASFQPTLSGEAYVIDTETSGSLRPHRDFTLEQMVLQLPRYRKRQIDVSSGAELKKGHTYLVRLQERFDLDPNIRVKCSPRSSTGRIFLRTRLLADYSDCFDEVKYAPQSKGKYLGLWLLVQPLAFDTIVRAGQSLTQARFFTGYDSLLTESELKALDQQKPLLLMPPLQAEIKDSDTRDGLQINLDLEGFHTKKLVGLRTRHTTNTVDLQHVGVYDPHEFYEPVFVQDQGDTLVIPPGQCYLLYSREIVRIPPTHSAELQGRTHISLDGDLHLAGFFDPGFEAHAVFEVRSNEQGSITLHHGMPMSRFHFFRNTIPKHPYGSGTLGSHFQGQVGPQPPKCFKPLKYEYVRP